MKQEEIRKILGEVDILLLLAERGRMEFHHFAWHMVVWGLYVALNMGWHLLGMKIPNLPLHSLSWFYTLFIAFFFSTLPSAGWKRSSLWLIGYVVSVLTYTLTHAKAWTVAAILVFATVAGVWVYGTQQKSTHPRPSLFAWIGMLWGFLFGAFWWSVALFDVPHTHTIFSLWITHVFGAALLASVVLHRGFFWIGLLLLFLGPLLLKMGMVPWMAGYAFTGLMMAFLGLQTYRHDR